MQTDKVHKLLQIKWFGLLRTINYFIIFCKIVKKGTAYGESSFGRTATLGF